MSDILELSESWEFNSNLTTMFSLYWLCPNLFRLIGSNPTPTNRVSRDAFTYERSLISFKYRDIKLPPKYSCNNLLFLIYIDAVRQMYLLCRQIYERACVCVCVYSYISIFIIFSCYTGLSTHHFLNNTSSYTFRREIHLQWI